MRAPKFAADLLPDCGGLIFFLPVGPIGFFPSCWTNPPPSENSTKNTAFNQPAEGFFVCVTTGCRPYQDIPLGR